MLTEEQGDFQFQTDGRTVWVSTALGGTVGRLNPVGMDVHTSDNTGCQDCGPIRDRTTAWERFKKGMLSVHGVEVPDKFKPSWAA